MNHEAHQQMLQSHKDAKQERRQQHKESKTHRKIIPINLI